MIRPMQARRAFLAAALAAGLAALYWALSQTGVLASLGDKATLAGLIDRLGYWGPAVVMLVMSAAVLVGVIPTAPISLAAGAAYGNVWGTLYIVLGSGAGAVMAFLIARHLAYDAVRRWDWASRHLDEERSQAALMLTVFVLRVVPFIHLDPISYVAGLTPLRLWRFAVATFAGITPMSFVLVTLGDRVAASDMDPRLAVGLLVIGLVLLPAGAKLLWSWYRSRAAS
jgi:uncharacterized membrane protein YdjX (TVP38/TMEM64 family)